MNFFKKLFKKNEIVSPQIKTGESPNAKKIIAENDVLAECVQVFTETLEKGGYNVIKLNDNPLIMPQLNATKNGVNSHVFVFASKQNFSPREAIEKDTFKKHIALAHNNNTDCMVAIVHTKNVTTGNSDLYYGDEISYTCKSDIFPKLGF